MSLTDAGGLPGQITPVSYQPPETMTYDEWKSKLRLVRNIEGSVMWWIGDMINWGQSKWGEKYSDAMEATDYDYHTLARASLVARRFPPHRRNQALSFSHHRELADLPEDQQDEWLQKAQEQNWSVVTLREERRATPGDDPNPAPGVVPQQNVLRAFRNLSKEARLCFERVLQGDTGNWEDEVSCDEGTVKISLKVEVTPPEV